ncbi:hypothetical protein D3C78_1294510 [compost metagenome]
MNLSCAARKYPGRIRDSAGGSAQRRWHIRLRGLSLPDWINALQEDKHHEHQRSARTITARRPGLDGATGWRWRVGPGRVRRPGWIARRLIGRWHRCGCWWRWCRVGRFARWFAWRRSADGRCATKPFQWWHQLCRPGVPGHDGVPGVSGLAAQSGVGSARSATDRGLAGRP